jgi:hypothetical protein
MTNDDEDLSRGDGERLSDRQDLAQPATSSVEALHVGDMLRFSVALLQQLYEEPEHRSRLVEVVRIVREADGALLLHLQARESHPAVDASDPQAPSTGNPTQREEDVPLPFAPLKWPA